MRGNLALCRTLTMSTTLPPTLSATMAPNSPNSNNPSPLNNNPLFYGQDLLAPLLNPPIEALELPELLKNPHILSMYKSWTDATQMQHNLWQENQRLRNELEALKLEQQKFM